MKTTERFDNAVSKLYTAYHEDLLNAYNCSSCAVGTICNGNSDWSIMLQYNDFRLVIYMYLKEDDFKHLNPTESVKKTGYSPYEISMIEKIFLDKARGANMNNTEEKRESEFKGLCAVVEYLCELDNIPNVMDYTKLFETENEKPKYQLNTTKLC